MIIPRNITARRLVSALKRDGFELIRQKGSHRTYAKGNHLVTISYHRSSDTFPIKTLRGIIGSAGWTEADLRRLRLIG